MGFLSILFHSLFNSPEPISNKSPSSNTFSGTFSEYEQIYSIEFDSNLNYSNYIFSGKFSKTGKMRTKRRICVFEGDDTLSAIKSPGYEEPISYTREIPSSPSEAQLNYLYDLATERGETVPEYLSFTDASALISRYVDRDSIPNPALFQYATEMHIGVSYFTGKRNLYDIVFAQLSPIDKYAFFIFCVYRNFNHSMTGNLNRCNYRELFYNFAHMVEQDSKFQKSINDNYYGSDLRFFGSKYSKELGYSLTGGSKRTYAYKTARDFLQNNRLI